jgi:hypothetical protein
VVIEVRNDDFFKALSTLKGKLVLYGAGYAARKVYPYLSRIDYVCDQKADGTLKLHDITAIKPSELEGIGARLIILVCIIDEQVSEQIVAYLKTLAIEGVVFCYNNISHISKWDEIILYKEERAIKRINIVCTEPVWIFRKFADRMAEELTKKGFDVQVGLFPDRDADINHYIDHSLYKPICDLRDTLMVSHIDSLGKLSMLKTQLSIARMGICMSNETMLSLAQMGLPREKLCYINPAHDGKMKHKKYVLGVTHKVHGDRRKRVSALTDICKAISPDFFEIKIMGMDWEEIVSDIRAMGFEVEYHNEFDYEKYHELMPTLDYYLFWGYDEGSMGYLDALAAGVDTIVTPQGFHLDFAKGITHSCQTVDDIISVLQGIEKSKRDRIGLVENLTWAAYVDKHLEVWNYILGNGYEVTNKHKYLDGINSVLVDEMKYV